MPQVHAGRAPSYLHSCVSASADINSRPRLRSTSCSRRYGRQRKRLKFGERFRVPDQQLVTVCITTACSVRENVCDD